MRNNSAEFTSASHFGQFVVCLHWTWPWRISGITACHDLTADMAKLFSSLFKDLRALSLSNIEFFQHGTSSTQAKFHQSFVMLYEHLDRYCISILARLPEEEFLQNPHWQIHEWCVYITECFAIQFQFINLINNSFVSHLMFIMRNIFFI